MKKRLAKAFSEGDFADARWVLYNYHGDISGRYILCHKDDVYVERKRLLELTIDMRNEDIDKRVFINGHPEYTDKIVDFLKENVEKRIYTLSLKYVNAIDENNLILAKDLLEEGAKVNAFYDTTWHSAVIGENEEVQRFIEKEYHRRGLTFPKESWAQSMTKRLMETNK